MSRELQPVYFARPFSSNFDFKRINFAYKFQEYPFSDRYYARSVSALLFRLYAMN